MSKFATARQLGLVLCHDCNLLVAWPTKTGDGRALCPRCHSPLHQRKPNSLTRTWAFVLAATILYIPANLFPIMITTSFGDVQADTILSGVIHFLKTGSFGIAIVIFVASIIIPLAKILVLSFLLLSVHFRLTWRPKDRTLLYRVTEYIGRWSMIDIYVVTIVVALVKLGALANVDAGPAAVYFAAVVVLTMLAAESFDPRLIWDVIEDNHEHE